MDGGLLSRLVIGPRGTRVRGGPVFGGLGIIIVVFGYDEFTGRGILDVLLVLGDLGLLLVVPEVVRSVA